MGIETTSAEGSRPDGSDLDEREVLFNAYLDGELSDQQEAEFDERLDEDPEFREAYGEFAEVVEGVQHLPYEFAPDDFSNRVRKRIRDRSRGRFFSDNILYEQRTPYEVIAVVMIVIMASAYLFMGIPPDRQIESSEEKSLELPPKSETSQNTER